MLEDIFPLPTVSPGTEVILVSLGGGQGLKSRLMDMGIKEGGKLKVLHSHRSGPCVIQVGNSRLVLGCGMAQKILVRSVRDE